MIGKTEVTQEQWKAVMGSNPSGFKCGNLPVENVSWDDCQEFIKELNNLTELNFRLLTEAEWEYAARGGNKSKGYKYSGSDNINDVAWSFDNTSGSGGTRSVATKKANELGLYDMSGNVREWCSDCYVEYSSLLKIDKTERLRRVRRGGCVFDGARWCRVSSRAWSEINTSCNQMGLRLAHSL